MDKLSKAETDLEQSLRPLLSQSMLDEIKADPKRYAIADIMVKSH